MSIADIKNGIEHKMQQSIEAFRNSLTKIRTGRANPAILDTVHVDYYGSMSVSYTHLDVYKRQVQKSPDRG